MEQQQGEASGRCEKESSEGHSDRSRAPTETRVTNTEEGTERRMMAPSQACGDGRGSTLTLGQHQLSVTDHQRVAEVTSKKFHVHAFLFELPRNSQRA